jgi:hypothetical protein
MKIISQALAVLASAALAVRGKSAALKWCTQGLVFPHFVHFMGF